MRQAVIKVYDYSLAYSITEASSAFRPEHHPEAIPMPGPSRGDHLWQQHDHADPAHLALAGEKFAGRRQHPCDAARPRRQHLPWMLTFGSVLLISILRHKSQDPFSFPVRLVIGKTKQ